MKRISLFAIGSLSSGIAIAADPLPISETIVVTGKRETVGAAFETRHFLTTDQIDILAAPSLDYVVRQLPSAHVPVNSRGEAIVFLRNAAERQVALFYEGASLNVPWDNRLDLSLVPAALIGSARSAVGPLAPHYGVNALGAVSFSPRDKLHLATYAGSGSLYAGEAAVPLGEVTIGGSVLDQKGERLSDDAELPFRQSGDDLRTNTDRELASLFARAAHQFGNHELSLTAFHVWGEKGIAPESDRPSGSRFWRYPDVSHSMVIASAKSHFGEQTELNSAGWFQAFGQTINNYSNDNYDTITLRQVDRDRTWGFRELLKHQSGPATFVGSFNYLDSTHKQRDIGYVAGEPPATLPAQLLYSQRNWSVGGEVEYALLPSLVAELGVGFDKVDYVKTGDKPPIKDAQSWTGRAGMVYGAGNGWQFRGAVGRKMRAPTMRELFGQALNRFLINPDLKPERIITAELGAEWSGDRGEVHVIPFIQDVKNTIDQRNVGPLRQRINLKGSKVLGIEVGGTWKATPELTLSGSATLSDVERKTMAPDEEEKLAEKPAVLAQARADYRHPSGFNTSLQLEHVGSAYSANAAGTLVPLEKSTSINWRAGYEFGIMDKKAELFVLVDNVSDTLIEPQIGLPAPGRSARIGFRIGG